MKFAAGAKCRYLLRNVAITSRKRDSECRTTPCLFIFFLEQLPDGALLCRNEHFFRNLPPALPCPPGEKLPEGACFAGTSIPLFPARPGQLSLGVASTPLNPRGHALEKSRPLSRVLSWTVIPLGCASPRSSSDLPGSLTWATWCGRHAPRASLFGLAPGGVCRAADVATRAVRSYRTISPLPAPLARHLGGIFLLHFPWAHAPQALPGTVPCGARTFLHVLAHTATAWPTLDYTIRRYG